MRICFSIFVVMGLCVAAAQGREWMTPDGKLWVTGELVEVRGSLIDLKTEDGKTITITLQSLSRPDQLYVQKQQADSAGDPPGDDLEIQSKLRWDEIQFVGGNPPPVKTLVISLTAKNKATANASRYGDIRIDKIETDLNTPLQLSVDTLGANEQLRNVDRNSSSRIIPVHGLIFDIRFLAPTQPIRSIRRLAGSFQIVTGERKTIVVKNLQTIKDLKLDNELLKELALVVVVNPTGNTGGTISFDGMERLKTFKVDVAGEQDRVFSIEMTDAHGRKYYLPSQQAAGSARHRTHYLSFDGDVPSDLQLQITVLKNPHQERIPFDFTNLQVPQQP